MSLMGFGIVAKYGGGYVISEFRRGDLVFINRNMNSFPSALPTAGIVVDITSGCGDGCGIEQESSSDRRGGCTLSLSSGDDMEIIEVSIVILTDLKS